MSAFLHYLHHLWFDPISASEKFEAFLLIGLPMTAVIGIGAFLWETWWEAYTEEKD
jgi:hypothetical protein